MSAGDHLSVHNIGDAGARALAVALRDTTSLVKVDLSVNWTDWIGDTGAAYLADALRVNTSLKYLGLGQNHIGDAGATALADALRVNTTLTYLSLDNNRIGDAGATALASALHENKTLTSLNLFMNKIGDTGQTALAEAVKYHSKRRIRNVPGRVNEVQNRTHRLLFETGMGFGVTVKPYLTRAEARALEKTCHAADSTRFEYEFPLQLTVSTNSGFLSSGSKFKKVKRSKSKSKSAKRSKTKKSASKKRSQIKI